MGLNRPMQLLKEEVDRIQGLTLYARDDFSAYRQRRYECRSCEVTVIRICSNSYSLSVFGVYRNPNPSAKMFDYLLTAMAKVQ